MNDEIRNNGLEAEEETQLVCFMLSGDEYCIPIQQVKEIVRLEGIVKLPNIAEFLEGAMELRGQMVPVTDLRKRFNMEPFDGNRKALILKISAEDFIGAIIDDITEIISAAAKEIMPLSTKITGSRSAFLKGIVKKGGRSIILLNVTELITEREVEIIRQAGLEGGNLRPAREPSGLDGGPA